MAAAAAASTCFKLCLFVQDQYDCKATMLPTKRPLTPEQTPEDDAFCPNCSKAHPGNPSGAPVILGKGSTSCMVCRFAHDKPAPLGSKRPTAGRKDLKVKPAMPAATPTTPATPATHVAPTKLSPNAPTKITMNQYSTLMLWLAKDENRNIVTGKLQQPQRHFFALSHVRPGASGSVTNGGSNFASSQKKVVPKTQGFAMLAAVVNRDHPRSGWTADIASKKYLYLHGKYSAAKQASYRSDWGLSQIELGKGITLADKLDGLCRDFEAWDR